METYNILGHEYPITDTAVVDKKGSTVPIVDIPMMTDYDWQKGALESRLKYREKYAELEDVEASITQLEKWLAEHR